MENQNLKADRTDDSLVPTSIPFDCPFEFEIRLSDGTRALVSKREITILEAE